MGNSIKMKILSECKRKVILNNNQVKEIHFSNFWNINDIDCGKTKTL